MSISMKKNYLLNMTFQLITIIIPIITTPYVSRVLGVDNIGAFSYANSTVSYFVLFSILGTSLYGQRKIAFDRDDKVQRSQDFWNILCFRAITSLTALSLYGLYIIFIEKSSPLFFIMSYNIINVIFDITWFYQGLEDFKGIAVKNILVKILATLCIFIFIKNKSDLWKYVAIFGCSTILGSLALWLGLKKHIQSVVTVHPFSDLKDIFLVFLPTIAASVYTVMDKSMIGWITNSNMQNGCYDRAEAIVKMGLTVVTAVGTVVLPRISNLFSLGKFDELRIYIYKTMRFIFFLGLPLNCGLLGVSRTLVPVFLGPGYENSILLMKILSALIPFIGISYTLGYIFLIPTKKQNVYTIGVSLAAFSNMLVNIVVIPFWGAIGAAIATVISEAIGAFYQLYYCYREKSLDISRLFFPSWRYLCASFLMLIVLEVESSFLSPTVAALAIQIISGMITYFFLVWITRDDFFKECINICIKYIKAKY